MSAEKTIRKEDIILGFGETEYYCPVCGKKQYFINDAYELHTKSGALSEDCDFFITEDMFGCGFAYPLYIISQRFYKLLKDNNICDGVRFAPVIEA